MKSFLLGYARKATVAAAVALGSGVLLVTADGVVTTKEAVIVAGSTVAAALLVFKAKNTTE